MDWQLKFQFLMNWTAPNSFVMLRSNKNSIQFKMSTTFSRFLPIIVIQD